LSIIPSKDIPLEAQVLKTTSGDSFSESISDVRVNRITPKFFSFIQDNIEITKDEPVRIVMVRGKSFNKVTGEMLLMMFRESIDTRGSPLQGIRQVSDKTINIVKIHIIKHNIAGTRVP
jgi:hypothetical protein